MESSHADAGVNPAPAAWPTRRVTLFAIYLLVNVSGGVLVFYAAHGIVERMRQEERNYFDSVDSITFFGHAFPVLLVCFLVNVGWFIKALTDVIKRRDYGASVAFGIVLIVWAATVVASRLDQ